MSRPAAQKQIARRRASRHWPFQRPGAAPPPAPQLCDGGSSHELRLPSLPSGKPPSLKLHLRPPLNQAGKIRHQKTERKREPEARVSGAPLSLTRRLRTDAPHRIPIPAPSCNPVGDEHCPHQSACARWSAVACSAPPTAPSVAALSRPASPSPAQASPAQTPREGPPSPPLVQQRKNGTPGASFRALAPVCPLGEKPQNLRG